MIRLMCLISLLLESTEQSMSDSASLEPAGDGMDPSEPPFQSNMASCDK